MLTLSIQQPWAWLIVNGYKDIENRDWPTKVRGRIRVHAGKKFDQEAYEFIKEEHPAILIPAADEIPRGGIVGEVTITGCVEQSASPWFFGRYGFTLTDGKPLPLIPCKGKLGFFKTDS